MREKGDWEAWLEFFLEGVKETSDQAADTAKQILELFETDRQVAWPTKCLTSYSFDIDEINKSGSNGRDPAVQLKQQCTNL